MFTDYLRRVIIRDVSSVRAEIAGYSNDAQIWATPPGMNNAGGTLVLHLVGNIRHLIGAQLGRTDYVRDRDAEFNSRNTSRSDLIALVDKAIADAEKGFAAIRDEDLDRAFPVDVGGVRLSTGQLLVHITAHLAYHLGQLDYHRRVVTGSNQPAGTVSIGALSSR
jgi:hypothetical protein